MRAAIAPLPHLENRPLALATAFLLAGLVHALIFCGPTLAPQYERQEKTLMRAPAIELDMGLLERVPAQVKTPEKQEKETPPAKQPETAPTVKPDTNQKAEQQKPAEIKKSETKPARSFPRETVIKKAVSRRGGKENGISEQTARTENKAAKALPGKAQKPPAALPAPLPGASNPKPQYPVLARKRGQEGIVKVLCQVNANGNVTGVSLAQGSGFHLLNEAALKTARRWKFRPGQEDGVNVAGEITIAIEFRLLDE